MRFSREQLRDKALAALDEAERQSHKGPVARSRALAFALSYLWAQSSADRAMFVWFWQSLDGAEPIGRTQNVSASLNGIYRAIGRTRP